jgi:hypothetical protein
MYEYYFVLIFTFLLSSGMAIEPSNVFGRAYLTAIRAVVSSFNRNQSNTCEVPTNSKKTKELKSSDHGEQFVDMSLS